MALRWRKDPRATGLARVCAGPRGSGLYDGDDHYASVSAKKDGFAVRYDGWYWVASHDKVPYKNTCNETCETEAEAKKAAMEYVKKNL